MANDFDSNVTEAERVEAYNRIINASGGELFDRRTAEASGIRIVETTDIYPDAEDSSMQEVFSGVTSWNRGLLERIGSRGKLARLNQAVEGTFGYMRKCVLALTSDQEAEFHGHLLSGSIEISAYTLPSQGYKLVVNREDGQYTLMRTPGRIGLMIGRRNETLDGYEHAVVAVLVNGYRYRDLDDDEISISPKMDIASISHNDVPFNGNALQSDELKGIVKDGSWLTYTSSSDTNTNRFYLYGEALYSVSAIFRDINSRQDPI